ncbi:MAG TPA: hypothetical protein VHN99_06890 [Deinococcales bacterium]|nr:hypothetical protein [Deinococcales bacterium]
MDDPIPLLVITGPVGMGKTTAMNEVAYRLEEAGLPHAAVDMDALRAAWPTPPGDRFGEALGLRNLALVWREFAAAGAARLVLADVMEEAAQRDRYARAVPGAIVTVARLRAPVPVLQERVVARELGAGRDWHLARAAELAAQMDADRLEDFIVETGGRTVAEIAREIVERWTGTSAR